MGGQRSGKGMVRRLAVLLGSAALVLPLAEPVGQRTGALARYLLAMAATATPVQAQTIETLPGVVVDSTSLNTVDEGGTATSYTVKLNTDPGSSTATVTPTSGDTGALAVSPASLTFTTSDWNTGKTVTVTSVEDDDLRNETVTISHSASGYGSVTSADAVTVAVTDDDVPAVSVCDRTAEVQPSILAKISGITDCADVSTIHLRNITGGLRFRSDNLSSLQENDFAGLSSLEILWLLNNNSLSSLPEGIFDGLSALTQLQLENNSLSSLDVDVFADLSNLEGLSLKNNALSSLPEGIFNGLSSLNWISFHTNPLESLPGNIFHGLANLQRLNFYNNNLSSLDADIFNGLVNLQEIDLYSNSLSSLPEGIFNNLTSLQKLFLNSNSLGSLSADVFSGLSNLDTLRLDNNSLNSLDADIFAGLSSLQYLYFNENNLRSLPEGIFAGLSSLLQVFLANNNLVCLPRSVASDSDLALDSATVTLPDCFGVSLSVTPTEVQEGNDGESITVSATLRAGQRTSSVATEVSISVAGGTAAEGMDFTAVDNFTITIPSGSESATGTFTLMATADNVAEPGGETVLVSGASVLSSSSVPGTEVSDATVTIKDGPGVNMEPTNVNAEEGRTASYTVKLITLPAGNVTITPTSGDSGMVSVLPASLTFATSDWNTFQTVSVTAAEDGDGGDETVTISHSVSGYGSLTAAPAVTVTVTDDDAPEVSVCDRTNKVQERILEKISDRTDCAEVSVAELNGITGRLSFYFARLGSFQKDDFADLSSLQELSLTGNSLSSLDAAIFADLAKLEQLELNRNSLTSLPANTFNGLSNLENLNLASNSLNNLDANIFNDLSKLKQLYLSSNNLSNLSGNIFNGLSNLEELYLFSNSLNSLSVDIFAGLTNLQELFLYDNNLSSLPDDIFNGLSNLEGLSLAGGDNDLVCLPTSVPWNRVALNQLTLSSELPDCFRLSLSVTPTALEEGSGEESITVSAALSAGPRGRRVPTQVTISVAGDTATEGTDFTAVDDFIITIPNGSESATGTFTLTATADEVAEPGGETVLVSGTSTEMFPLLSGGSGEYAAEVSSATLTIQEAPGVSITPPTLALTVNESGSGSYTLQLNTQPAGAVTITPVNSDSSVASVSPPNLTFTRSNWDTPRPVSVTPVDDNTASENRTVTVSHGVSGYGSVTAAAAVTVTVTDDDIPGVNMQPTSMGPVVEGETASYTLQLNTQPAGAVTITPVNSDSSVVSVSPPNLTFTRSNWNTPQTVSVTPVDDNTASENRTVTVSHGVSGYGSVTAAAAVTVTVTDDDIPGVNMQPTSMGPVVEGETASYTLQLNTQPAGAVTITPVNSDSSVVSVSPPNLTFTPSNWDTPRPVSVTPVDDNTASENRTVTVSHGVSGYGSVTAAAAVTVTVTDDDIPGVNMQPTSVGPVVEGETASYTLQLNTQPAGAVTITPVNSDSSVVSVSPPNLTFTRSNWNTPQTVSVTPVDDNTASENRTVTVSHGVSGYGSVTAAAAVTVTVTDDDIPGVNMQPTSMGPVVEGETASYTLQLNTQPAGAVTITPVNSDSSVVSVSPPNLTFTPSNWDTPRPVSVTPVDDNTASENRTVTVSHGVSGYGSVTAAAAVTVTVTDDDIPGVNMQPTSVGPVVEGETASYTLQLNTQPAGAVTITPVNSDSGAVSLSPASITFTPSNWNTAQTVSVTGVQDDDTDDETLTLSHSVSGYGGVTAAAAVTVSVTDDDTAPTPSPGDATSPLVTIMNVPPTSSTPFTATITFNEVVSGFMVDDITAVNATLSDFTEATTGEATSGTAWTVLVTPRADGLVTLDVAMNVAEDAAGNGNAAAAQAHSTYTAPARETEAAQEAKAVLNQVILPDVLQQLTAETTEVVTSRLNTIASGSPGAPPSLSLDDVVADTVAAIYGEREHLKDGSLDWRQALSGRDFVLPLSGFNLAQSDSTGTQDNPFSSLALWGGGNYASYRNIIENTDVDGNGFSAVIGMDLQPIPQLTTGLALTTTRWGLDYLTDANGTRAEGTYEIGVIMVNPYVNWLATEQLSLWGTFGYGHGEVEQDPEDGNATTRTDGLTSWAGGLRFEVVPGVDPRTGEGAPFGLAFKADGATSSFLEMSVQLARLAAEVSHSFSIEDGLLNVALELGWRLRSVSDNSNLDGQQLAVTEQNDGSGAELAGNLNWRNTDGSLSATVDTRVLLGSGHHREWGIGGHLRFTPSRRNGEGLSLSLQPSFGVTGTRLDELWSLSSNDDLAIHNDHPVAWLDAQLAYGFPLGNAILNPYTELRWEEAANTYGAGLRYGLNPSLELDLKGTHHHNANGTTENRLLLQMRSDF